MAKRYMDVNNVTDDPTDNKYNNYYLERTGPIEDAVEMPADMEDYVVIECNKKTQFYCLEALHQDGRTL